MNYSNGTKNLPKEEELMIMNEALSAKMPRILWDDIVFKDENANGLITPMVDPM